VRLPTVISPLETRCPPGNRKFSCSVARRRRVLTITKQAEHSQVTCQTAQTEERSGRKRLPLRQLEHSIHFLVEQAAF
jgi:hypothetical protein